jgi:hypothetical protein
LGIVYTSIAKDQVSTEAGQHQVLTFHVAVLAQAGDDCGGVARPLRLGAGEQHADPDRLGGRLPLRVTYEQRRKPEQQEQPSAARAGHADRPPCSDGAICDRSVLIVALDR